METFEAVLALALYATCTISAARDARIKLLEAGLAELQRQAQGRSDTAVDRLGQHYEQHLARLRAAQENDLYENMIAQDSEDYRALTLLTLKAERKELGRLRKSGAIDDEVALELQQEIDLNEILVGTVRGAG